MRVDWLDTHPTQSWNVKKSSVVNTPFPTAVVCAVGFLFFLHSFGNVSVAADCMAKLSSSLVCVQQEREASKVRISTIGIVFVLPSFGSFFFYGGGNLSQFYFHLCSVTGLGFALV